MLCRAKAEVSEREQADQAVSKLRLDGTSVRNIPESNRALHSDGRDDALLGSAAWLVTARLS